MNLFFQGTSFCMPLFHSALKSLSHDFSVCLQPNFKPACLHGTISIQSLSRFGQDLHTGSGIHQASDSQSPRLPADTCRDLYQQGYGGNERAHPDAALRHLEGRPRIGCLPETYQRRFGKEAGNRLSFRQGVAPTRRNGIAVYAARLQPLPRGDNRLVFPVGHAQPCPRTGTQPQPEHRAEQRRGAERRRRQHD